MKKERADEERRMWMGVLLGTRDSTTGVIGESDGGESGFMNKRERAARKTTAGEDTRIANKVDAPAPNAGGNNEVNLDLWRAIAKMDDGELHLCFLELGLVVAGRHRRRGRCGAKKRPKSGLWVVVRSKVDVQVRFDLHAYAGDGHTRTTILRERRGDAVEVNLCLISLGWC